MDHLPYPKYPALPPIEVPYICSSLDDYDGLDFSEYPIRRGWSRSVQSLEWMDCSLDEVARRAQNWLYFGFLHAILGETYNKDDFLRLKSDGDGLSIDTSNLNDIFVNWASSICRKGHKKVSQDRADPQNSFEVFDEIFRMADRESDVLDERQHCPVITCSIKLLIGSVQDIIGPFDHRVKGKASMFQFNIVPPRIAIPRMIENGWCPHQLFIMFTKQLGSLVYYLSGLSRHKMNVNHQGCSGYSCIAHNIDITNYTVRHVYQGCDCQFYGPDMSKVVEIIQDGHIPLVSLILGQNGNPRLEVMKSEQGVDYTAISHVWSGGLGAIASNKLPSCQLVQIHRYLNSLDRYREKSHMPCSWIRRLHIPYIKRGIYIGLRGSPRWARSELRAKRIKNSIRYFNQPQRYRVNFWMDTLCIPVGEANASLRTQSIKQMDLIYAGAQSTLVLDPELQRISMDGLAQEQLNAHVHCSAWMTRCWTLQEARLSREWYAQFADGLYDPIRARTSVDVKLEKAKAKPSSENAAPVISQSISWFSAMLPMQRTTVFANPKENELCDREIFAWAWNSLLQRSTSKPEDVLGILANLLSLSAGEVIALPYEQRMKAILRAHQTIPTSLLYSPASKIPDDLNRWVPIAVGGEHLPDLYGEIRIAAGHMILNHPSVTPVGFLVASSTPRLEKFCLVDTASSETLWVRLANDGADVGFECPSSIATCYIMGDLRASTLDRDSGKDWRGARFSVQKEEGSTLYLKYEYSLIYRHQDPLHRNDVGFVYPTMEVQRTTSDKIFRLDCNLDSWYDLHYRRDNVDVRTMSRHGFRVYTFAWAFVFLLVWGPFYMVVLLAVTKANRYRSLAGLLASIALKTGFSLLVDFKSINDLVDHEFYEEWVMSFQESRNSNQQKYQTARISLQFDLRYILAITLVAIGLIAFGMKVHENRWAFWIGLAILIELGLRLGIEAVCRTSQASKTFKKWFKKKGWW